MTTTKPAPLLRNHSYRLLLTGKTAETIGGGIGAFAVPLVAFEVTGSVVQAGVITAVGQAGAIVSSLPAGVLVDRTDRRRLIIWTALVGAAAWASLVVAGIAGDLTGAHLAVALFVSSVAGAILDPADSAALRAVVREEQLGAAMSVAQGREAAAMLLAGPVGGLLYGMGHVVPFLAGVIGRLTAAVTARLVRDPLNEDLSRIPAQHPLRSLREGLGFVWSVPLFRALIGLFALINIVLSAMRFAIDLDLVRAGTPPVLIGLLHTAVGVGVLAGSVLSAMLVERVRVGVLTVLALCVCAAAVVVMATLHTYWSYIGAMAGMMLFAPSLNAGMLSYQMAITPQQVQGRAAAVLGLTAVLAQPIGPLLGSLMLEGLGLRAALWSFAGALVVVTMVIATVRPMWRIGLPGTWADDALPWP